VTGRGAALVVADVDNVGDVALPAMIEQCCEAVDWTARNAASFGGPRPHLPRRPFVGRAPRELRSARQYPGEGHHFDEPRQLADPGSDLSAMLHALMKSKRCCLIAGSAPLCGARPRRLHAHERHGVARSRP